MGRLARKKIKPIQVKVPYANGEEKFIFSVEVSEEAIAREAVELPGIDDHFADIEMDQTAIGYSQNRSIGKCCRCRGTILEPEDRAEIYLPLLFCPKQARVNRAPKDRV